MMGKWAVKRWGSYGETLTIRLPLEIKMELKQEAWEKGLTLSDLVRLYLEEAMERKRKN